jgi:hypothetical protein
MPLVQRVRIRGHIHRHRQYLTGRERHVAKKGLHSLRVGRQPEWERAIAGCARDKSVQGEKVAQIRSTILASKEQE